MLIVERVNAMGRDQWPLAALLDRECAGPGRAGAATRAGTPSGGEPGAEVVPLTRSSRNGYSTTRMKKMGARGGQQFYCNDGQPVYRDGS